MRWLRITGGRIAVVAGCCLSFKVRDEWCEIRVEKELGFCVFLLGYCKSVFLIGLATHLFFWAEIEFKGAVYFLRNVWEGVDQIQVRLIELHLLIEVKMF